MSSQAQFAPSSTVASQPARTPPGQRWYETWLAEALACTAAGLIYITTLSFAFVYDDVPQILKNPAIQAWRFLPQYFTAHVWAAIYPNSTGNYYRPLFLLWMRLNYALFGTDAFGWHLTSVACHVLATWLVFRVAQKLSGELLTAFLAALVFAVHPAHIENVAWISGVTDPLMSCLVLGSFLAFLNFHESHEFGWEVLSLGLFASALLAKETSVVLPVLVFASTLIFGQEKTERGGAARRLVAAIFESSPFLLVVLIYAAMRFRALGSWSHPTIPIGWKEVLLTWPSVLWFYLRHLTLPFSLSEFYPLDYVKAASAHAVALPLALLLVAAVALFLLLRALPQKNVARFALVLIVVPLLPVLDLRSLTTGDIVHDRYLYLSSIGFALLVALALRELTRRCSESRLSFLPVAFTIAIVVAFAALTLVQQMQWASEISLYTRGLESAPANLTVRDNLANAFLEANHPERAIPLYLEVLDRNPNFWRSNYNLGFAYYKTANFERAENYLQRAISIDPNDSDQYIYLALAQLQLKKLPEARANAQRAIVHNPEARGYHSILALICETDGDLSNAASELRIEVNQHPDNAAAAAELQKIAGTHSISQP
jgi:tetratricopeptide (TPR) repeat protein